jgi:hypothetical protein
MTIYTGESEESALAEVLASFRPDLETIAAVNAMPADDNRMPARGRITKHWLDTRRLGQGKIRRTATLVDISHLDTIQALRSQQQLALHALRNGFVDLDDAALKTGGPNGRLLTQAVSQFIYHQGHHGIRYGSRLGSSYFCIAGFISLNSPDINSSEFLEHAKDPQPIYSNNKALRKVAQIFGLELSNN